MDKLISLYLLYVASIWLYIAFVSNYPWIFSTFFAATPDDDGSATVYHQHHHYASLGMTKHQPASKYLQCISFAIGGIFVGAFWFKMFPPDNRQNGSKIKLGRRNFLVKPSRHVTFKDEALFVGNDDCSICQAKLSGDDLILTPPVGDRKTLYELPSVTGRFVTELDCRHVYHEECIWTWLHENPSCPLCRRPVLEDETSNNN